MPKITENRTADRPRLYSLLEIRRRARTQRSVPGGGVASQRVHQPSEPGPSHVPPDAAVTQLWVLLPLLQRPRFLPTLIPLRVKFPWDNTSVSSLPLRLLWRWIQQQCLRRAVITLIPSSPTQTSPLRKDLTWTSPSMTAPHHPLLPPCLHLIQNVPQLMLLWLRLRRSFPLIPPWWGVNSVGPSILAKEWPTTSELPTEWNGLPCIRTAAARATEGVRIHPLHHLPLHPPPLLLCAPGTGRRLRNSSQPCSSSCALSPCGSTFRSLCDHWRDLL